MIINTKTIGHRVVLDSIKRENWKEWFTFKVANNINELDRELYLPKFYYETRECFNTDRTIYWHGLLVPFILLGYKIKWLWIWPAKKLKRAGYLYVQENESPLLWGWFWLHRIRFKKIICYWIKRFKDWNKWLNGYTGCHDMFGIEIYEGDFCETYDRTGLRWTAFIKREKWKVDNSGRDKFIDCFHSNWDVRLFDDWTKKQLKIIKEIDGR